MASLKMVSDNRKFLVGSYEKAFPEDVSLRDMMLMSAGTGYDFFEISIDLIKGLIGYMIRIFRMPCTRTYRKVVLELAPFV